MKVCVLTILDNLGNRGSLVQAAAMLKLFAAQGVIWRRPQVWEAHHSTSSIANRRFYEQLSKSPVFSELTEAVDYINRNFDLAVIGSDELWKAGEPGSPYSIPYPNPYWGSGIRIPKIALAVSTGCADFAAYSKEIRDQMAADLKSFDMIYVRDRKSARDMESLGVTPDGVLPDPTFAIDFKPTRNIPRSELGPAEWFASFANLDYCRLERMHGLLACIRGGTPCSSYDTREKSRELVENFQLPEGDEEHIKACWPYSDNVERCLAYRKQWYQLIEKIWMQYHLPGYPPTRKTAHRSQISLMERLFGRSRNSSAGLVL